jgi:hypothetical protein
MHIVDIINMLGMSLQEENDRTSIILTVAIFRLISVCIWKARVFMPRPIVLL